MRFARTLAPLAAALAFFLAPAFGDDAPKKLFWKVTNEKGGTVYLFGSIHVGTEDMYPLSKEVEDAFKKADALAVEADIEKMDAAKINELVMSKGMYGEEGSLNGKLSKDNWKKLRDYCKKEEIDVNQLKPLRPWLAALQLQGVAIQKWGVDASLGIDRHFLKSAHDDKTTKKVVELESAEFQIELIAGLSDEQQEQFLMSLVEEQAKGKEALDELLETWKKGDDAKFLELTTKSVKDHPEWKAVMDKLITDRNVGMTKKIEGFLAEKGTTFVTVGSAHMVGDKGIVKLLEATGKYKIERPSLTAPAKEKDKEPQKSEKKEKEGAGAK